MVKAGDLKDPIEKAIIEQGLRIVDVLAYKDLDLLAVVLNSGHVLQIPITDHMRLSKASESDIKAWRLIGGGIGIHWEKLDEDLSLKGFIQASARSEALRKLARSRKFKAKPK